MENLIKLHPQLAALTLARICPIVSLNERPRVRQRFPIYSRKQVINPKNTPIEWLMEAHNQAVYGNIPAPENLPKGALTGYIETFGDSLCESSIWSRGLRDEQCRVCHARIFDCPIYISEYAVNDVYIYDDVLDEMTCHYIDEQCQPWVINDALEVPISNELFEKIPNLGVLTLDLCGILKKSVLDENGNLLKFSYLYLTSGNRKKIVKFCGEIFTETNSNGDPVFYPSIYEDDKMVTRRRLRLFL